MKDVQFESISMDSLVWILNSLIFFLFFKGLMEERGSVHLGAFLKILYDMTYWLCR